MAHAVSQINRIKNALVRNPEGLTKSGISKATNVPKGNILSHIAMLRKRFGEDAVLTDRRTLDRTNKRKVYFKANVELLVPKVEKTDDEVVAEVGPKKVRAARKTKKEAAQVEPTIVAETTEEVNSEAA
jgi:hypothetical protein